jgi:hypothetical protein
MASDLYQVIDWAKTNGEVKVLDRIKLKTLSKLVQERVTLDQVTPATTCSPELVAAVRAAASDVVGKPCPV